MTVHTVCIFRAFGSTILVRFDSRDAALGFSARYYFGAPNRDSDTDAKFYAQGSELVATMSQTKICIFNEDIAANYGNRQENIQCPITWSERGTVLLSADEAATLYMSAEPDGYPVGESEAIWTRETRTHEELDAELKTYFLKADD